MNFEGRRKLNNIGNAIIRLLVKFDIERKKPCTILWHQGVENFKQPYFFRWKAVFLILTSCSTRLTAQKKLDLNILTTPE